MINDLCNDMRLEELVYSVVWEFSKFDPCSKALTNVWTSVASLFGKRTRKQLLQEKTTRRGKPRKVNCWEKAGAR
jgi:hypothetical protein